MEKRLSPNTSTSSCLRHGTSLPSEQMFLCYSETGKLKILSSTKPTKADKINLFLTWSVYRHLPLSAPKSLSMGPEMSRTCVF